MTSIERIDKLALNTLEGFMYSLGITPSEGSLVFADFGPHRVYTLQGVIDSNSERGFNLNYIFSRFEKYLRNYKNFYKAPHFDAFEIIKGYNNQGQIMLYVSISHTA